jgi:hypothetical protein
VPDRGEAPEPMLDVARGDQLLSRHLRRSIELLRDHTDDKDFRRQLDDVLAGRQSLREAAFTGTFDRGLSPHFERGLREWERLSEAEHDRLAQEGEAVVDVDTGPLAEQPPAAGEPAAPATAPPPSPAPRERSTSHPARPQSDLPTVQDGWEGPDGSPGRTTDR